MKYRTPSHDTDDNQSIPVASSMEISFCSSSYEPYPLTIHHTCGFEANHIPIIGLMPVQSAFARGLVRSPVQIDIFTTTVIFLIRSWGGSIGDWWR
mmetsp:Transcript_29166/g.27949  ORF Transcript_29166/g.27949 Transcript_29166/m.27949 type:complete len:96 (+) Transcript_29166:647-934(+)